MPNKSSEKKREGIIIPAPGKPIKIQDSEEMGLKWDKPSAVQTGAGKVISASGSQEEISASEVLRDDREVNAAVGDAPAAETVGFGKGAGTKKARRAAPKVSTATSGPTSRAEPKVARRGKPSDH